MSLLSDAGVSDLKLRIRHGVPSGSQRDPHFGHELLLHVEDIVLRVLQVADVLGRFEAVDVVSVGLGLLS